MTAGHLDESDGGPRLLLAAHHDELEAACRDIDVAVQFEDPQTLVTTYRAFEKSVLEHLAAEEDEILAAYLRFDPRDAFAVRNEHDRIRAQLFALGVEVELHQLRATTLQCMIEMLRSHAQHEDRGMYPWAQTFLPMSTKHRLLTRIRESADTLVRLRRAFKERTNILPTPKPATAQE